MVAQNVLKFPVRAFAAGPNAFDNNLCAVTVVKILHHTEKRLYLKKVV